MHHHQMSEPSSIALQNTTASLDRFMGQVMGLFFAAAIVLASAIGGPVVAQEVLKQIPLTDAQVQNYIKAAPELAKMFDRIDKADGKLGKKLKADLEAVAKNSGFASFDEMQDVSNNIQFVMQGMDEKGSFREPQEFLKLDLAEVKADKSIEKKEKKQIIASIEDQLENTPKLSQPGNVGVVKKHLKTLMSLFREGKDDN